MGFTFVKQSLTDGETRINKALLDPMQDGIVDAQERLAVIERWMNKANYKKISVNVDPSSGRPYLYGTDIGSGRWLYWTLNKDATIVSITTPAVDANRPSRTYTKKLATDDDGNVYIEVILPGGTDTGGEGIIKVWNEGQDNEYIEWEQADGTIIKDTGTEDNEKPATNKYNGYRNIKLKAGEKSSFGDYHYNYWVIRQLKWTIYAKEADGQLNDDGTVTYNYDEGYYTIDASYNVYYGKSKNDNENSSEFIAGLVVDGVEVIKPMNTIKDPITSHKNLSIEFADGANEEYLYVALPANLYSSKPTFDIWEDRVNEEFVLTGQVNFPLVSAAYLVRYDLYRSPNKIIDKDPIDLEIS